MRHLKKFNESIEIRGDMQQYPILFFIFDKDSKLFGYFLIIYILIRFSHVGVESWLCLD